MTGRRAALCVAAAVLVAYHDALSAGFVLDDYHYILEHAELTARHIPALFWRGYASGGVEFYRPLTTATFALDRSLFGLWAAGYHAHNLAWHLGASLLVGALTARLSGRGAGLVAALLFAVHPLHTEAVTGIVGRSELMATALLLLGCLWHLDERPVLAALAYLGALCSKESGVTLPLLALLVDAQRRPWRAALPRLWPFAVPLALYVALRLHALSGATLPPPAEYFRIATPAQAFWTAADALGRDLTLLVWPHPLSADYSYPALPLSPGPTSARTALTLAALVALAAVAVAARRRAPRLTLALAWFAVAIFPVSNLLVHVGVLLAERLLYLPSVALAIAAGAAWAWLRTRTRPLLPGVALGGLVAAGALGCALRNLDWQTPLDLWRDTVQKQPRSALAHGNLGLSCLVVGDRACARAELATAAALDPLRADFAAARDQLDSLP